MDGFNWGDRLGEYKKFMLPLGLGVIGLVFLGYGLMSFLLPKHEKQDILFEGASDSTVVKSSVSPTKGKQIMVDVEGAVQKPGVYEVGADSRLQDALIAAGGLSARADRAGVSKSLNLAAKVVDGAKVYIPVVGEAQPPQSPLSGGGSDVMGVSTGVVNINSASLSDLDALPGVGQVTAGKIIGNRPYGSVDELVQKKIVGKKVFEQIKDRVSVY